MNDKTKIILFAVLPVSAFFVLNSLGYLVPVALIFESEIMKNLVWF